MSIFEKADRLKKLPPYLFSEIDRKKREIKARGIDLIDLGIGDPDLPTPDHIIQAMQTAAADPGNHHYPPYSGMAEFRSAAAQWFKQRFGVTLDPEKEVLALIGSKEGIAHIPLAFVNPGDVALVPSPGYPVYNAATLFAGGESYFMPLLSRNSYLPDLEAIPAAILKRAKILFLNYPNNPTAALADAAFFKKVAAFAHKHKILVCHDAAYTEVAFDGYCAPSFLETQGAKEVGIEFHSLSKTYCMTGWRVGFAVGNAEAIEGLAAVKSNVDSSLFQAVQVAAIKALQHDQTCVKEMNTQFGRRRDLMVQGLKAAGFEFEIPKATFYVWAKVPAGYTSAQFAAKLLETGVVVTPGNGFGEPGEGYFRMAMTQQAERIEEAIKRIRALSF
jgi:LL-diaminopimelate aminotransferase